MTEHRSITADFPEAVLKALEDSFDNRAPETPMDFVAFTEKLNGALWDVTDGATSEERARLVQWALGSLDALSCVPISLDLLRIVLTTLCLSSESDIEAAKAVPLAYAQSPLKPALVALLESASTDIFVFMPRHLTEQQWRIELQQADKDADYNRLGGQTRHQTVIALAGIRMAILALLNIAPEQLASVIERQRDVVFSLAVQRILVNLQPVQFALTVNDITFKYLCLAPLADLPVKDVPESVVADVATLYIQVAQTDRWRGWIMAFARYPKEETVTAEALAIALAQLSTMHWRDFVDAIELWTLPNTARAVEKMLMRLFQGLGMEKSTEMWRMAFTRWEHWNYGLGSGGSPLLAPSSSSLDFPVAAYYACLPEHELNAEIEKLQHEISNVEQTWFPDIVSLNSEHNRLSSRLRLVRHGLTLRQVSAGHALSLLPQIEAENEFVCVRYSYYNLHAR